MTTILPNERVAEIRARAEKATPGPWEIGKLGDGQTHVLASCKHAGYVTDGTETDEGWARGSIWFDRDDFATGANIQFCAAARTDIPSLCDSHDAQAQRIGELEALNNIDEHFDMHAERCSNCDAEIIARLNGKPTPCLSDGEESGDLALCGACMGKEFYELDNKFGQARAEISTLKAKLAEAEKDTGRIAGLLRIASTAAFERIEIHHDIDEGGLWSIEIPGIGHVDSFINMDPRAAIDAAIGAASETGKVI